jgi:hypothetical protein
MLYKLYFRTRCRKIGEKNDGESNTSSSLSNENVQNQSSVVEQISKKRKLSSGLVKPFVIDKMSVIEKRFIDLHVTQFMIGCDIPLNVATSSHFHQMLQSLRKSYHPPGEEEIKGELLDAIYRELVELDVSPKEEFGTLLVNGTKYKELSVFVKPRFKPERFVKTYKIDNSSVDTIILNINSAIAKTQALYNIKCDSLCIDDVTLVDGLKERFKDLSIYSCKFEMLEELEKLLMDDEVTRTVYDLVVEILTNHATSMT